jgi:hypothetical protein
MEKIPLAYCGLDCSTCPVFIATANNDVNLKLKTADEWSKLYSEYTGKKELSLEDMNCQGCKSSNNTLFVGCINCPIRKCSMAKNRISCADCAEYESCEMLNGFFTTAPQAKDNLDAIRAAKNG